MKERGSAAVEFAMVLPLVLLTVLAVLQVALLGRDTVAVAHAAREGAREAAVTPDDAAVERVVFDRSGLERARTSVDVRRAGGIGHPVTVAVVYEAPVVAPLAGWLFPGSVKIEREVVMRQETGDG